MNIRIAIAKDLPEILEIYNQAIKTKISSIPDNRKIQSNAICF